METETQLAKPAPQKITTTSVDNGDFACFLDTAKFNQLWRVSQVFAASQLVPLHYQSKPNDCFVATQMSLRLGIDPMMFMQNTYVVHGKPGMLSQLVIALINARGPFDGPIQWKFSGTGDTRACTAYAKHKTTREICEATVTWEMATKEGWTTKNGSKWLTMPELMFQYRSAAFLGRLYCPECLMGMRTVDELIDIKANEDSSREAPAAGVAGLKERMAKQVESTDITEPPEPADSEHPETKDEFNESVEQYNQEHDVPDDKALREAEATAKAKFGKETEQVPCRYECKKCDREFEEPTVSGKCPFCISDKIKDRQES